VDLVRISLIVVCVCVALVGISLIVVLCVALVGINLNVVYVCGTGRNQSDYSVCLWLWSESDNVNFIGNLKLF
jgi:hypothetical protein